MSARRKTHDPALLAWLTARLEEAGATLLALPQYGMGPRLRQVRWPSSPHEAAAGGAGARLRPRTPDTAEISRMDQSFGWIGLIPTDKVLLRRIVHARSLVSPLTGRHLYSWRKLGGLLGADHKAVQRWHGDALALILARLPEQEKVLQIRPK